MCQVLNISRSGYYYWLNNKGVTVDRNGLLLASIRRIHTSSRGCYGSPRIAKVLKEEGIKASRPLVARIMKKAGIKSLTHKKFKVTTDSNHSFSLAENLLQRDFSTSRLGEKWVSDLTYIPTGEGWLYLTTVMDLADRKVIVWSLSNNMKAVDTTVAAFKMAIQNRPLMQSVIFHSDRGDNMLVMNLRNNLRTSLSLKV